MPGKVRVDRHVPRVGTLDRDMWVRGIARALIEPMWELDEKRLQQVEMLLVGLLHYLIGRVHDRPHLPREDAAWRGSAGLLPLAGGMLSQQRQTAEATVLALHGWFGKLRDECESNKFNPLAIKAFATLLRLKPADAAEVLDIAERAIRVELGDIDERAASG